MILHFDDLHLTWLDHPSHVNCWETDDEFWWRVMADPLGRYDVRNRSQRTKRVSARIHIPNSVPPFHGLVALPVVMPVRGQFDFYEGETSLDGRGQLIWTPEVSRKLYGARRYS